MKVSISPKSVRMSYPVVAECWNIFETSLMLVARKLVDDIATRNRADPKVLWARVRSSTKIPLVDVDIPDQHSCCYSVHGNSLVIELCRAPCLLGYDRCPQHISLDDSDTKVYEDVYRIKDIEGTTYFVGKDGLARDSLGVVKGMIEEDELYLFDKK